MCEVKYCYSKKGYQWIWFGNILNDLVLFIIYYFSYNIYFRVEQSGGRHREGPADEAERPRSLGAWQHCVIHFLVATSAAGLTIALLGSRCLPPWAHSRASLAKQDATRCLALWGRQGGAQVRQQEFRNAETDNAATPRSSRLSPFTVLGAFASRERSGDTPTGDRALTRSHPWGPRIHAAGNCPSPTPSSAGVGQDGDI